MTPSHMLACTDCTPIQIACGCDLVAHDRNDSSFARDAMATRQLASIALHVAFLIVVLKIENF